MLDSLSNVDLSSITGYIRFDSADAIGTTLLNGIIGLVAIGLLLWFLSWLLTPSKSREYRMLMTDMFVVGKIKQIAHEEKIDLIAELREYTKIQKKAKLKLKGLDEVIEEELKEKISKTEDK